MRRQAFTIIELLIAICIITILLSLGYTTLRKTMRSAVDSRARADLNTIVFCLEAYNLDFGDYPRPSDTDRASDRGTRILAKALIGPGDMLTSLPSPINATMINADGFNGAGFRTRRFVKSPTTFSYNGDPRGPYLRPDDFKLSKINSGAYDSSRAVGVIIDSGQAIKVDADDGYKILDYWGNPILYYVAKPSVSSTIFSTDGFIGTDTPGTVSSAWPFINAFDNLGCSAVPMMSEQNLRLCMGATDTGAYNIGKSYALAAYYLISAGRDGIYGNGDDIIVAGGSVSGSQPVLAAAAQTDLQILQGSTATVDTFFILPDSSDIQTYFDVQVDVLDPGGSAFATAQILKMKPAWRGNNDTSFTPVTLALTANRTVTFPKAGGNITLKVTARYAAGGHSSGTIALRYDCVKFPSSVSVNTNKGPRSFYLHTGNVMDANDNAGDTTIDDAKAFVKSSGGNPWVPVDRTWNGFVTP